MTRDTKKNAKALGRAALSLAGLGAVLVLLGGAGGGGCDSSIVGDPTFDLWCGENLCAWTVDKGEIRRVSTWHRSDYGVSLIGDPVVLWQDAKLDGKVPQCFEIRLQASHDDGVNLIFEVDFNADGKVDYSRPMATDDYRESTFKLRPPLTYSAARFIVRKGGAGRAVLAEVKIKDVDSGQCASITAIKLLDQADGAGCSANDECKSRLCVPVDQYIGASTGDVQGGTCTRCDDASAACGAGKVCGYAFDGTRLYRRCIDPPLRAVGERCGLDAECKGGVCCNGICSECCSGRGGSCSGCRPLIGQTELEPRFAFHGFPHQCGPQDGTRQSAEACFRDGDCRSGSCEGADLSVCPLTGRPCSSSEQCTLGACEVVGKRDGRCK